RILVRPARYRHRARQCQGRHGRASEITPLPGGTAAGHPMDLDGRPMQIAERTEWNLLATPLVAFLLLCLGFPAVVNLVYSVSDISFATLRSPTLSGFGNFA